FEGLSLHGSLHAHSLWDTLTSIPPALAGGSDTQRASWVLVPPADAGGTDFITRFELFRARPKVRTRGSDLLTQLSHSTRIQICVAGKALPFSPALIHTMIVL